MGVPKLTNHNIRCPTLQLSPACLINNSCDQSSTPTSSYRMPQNLKRVYCTRVSCTSRANLHIGWLTLNRSKSVMFARLTFLAFFFAHEDASHFAYKSSACSTTDMKRARGRGKTPSSTSLRIKHGHPQTYTWRLQYFGNRTTTPQPTTTQSIKSFRLNPVSHLTFAAARMVPMRAFRWMGSLKSVKESRLKGSSCRATPVSGPSMRAWTCVQRVRRWRTNGQENGSACSKLKGGYCCSGDKTNREIEIKKGTQVDTQRELTVDGALQSHPRSRGLVEWDSKLESSRGDEQEGKQRGGGVRQSLHSFGL